MHGTRANLLDHILNSTHDAIVAINIEGNVSVFNNAAERLSGKKAGDVLGKPVRNLSPTRGLIKYLPQAFRKLTRNKFWLIPLW